MDREKGIQAYQSMVSAEEYQLRLAKGDTTMVHVYKSDVGALEYLRQYSLSGDPADRSKYQIAVLREDEGKGGSRLLHRIFNEGRKVFIAKPINHFPLDEAATKTFLMGGGIGITPMLAMAHRLHAIGADFEVHYSFKSQDSAGFLNGLANMPWSDKVHLHCSAEGTRALLGEVFAGYQQGWHVYTCGPDSYMQSVTEAARIMDSLTRRVISSIFLCQIYRNT